MDNLQATLSTAEYVYILNLLSARTVIGTEQERLFPSDPNKRQALIAIGMSELKANQWLSRADGEGSPETQTLNNQLVLMVSITAAPELSLLVKRTTLHGHQYITYFIYKDIVIELIRTEDERYILTSAYLASNEFDRLTSLVDYGGSLQENGRENRVTVPSDLFDEAISAVRRTKSTDQLHTLLKAHQCDDETALCWSTILTQVKPNTFFEFSAHSTTRSVEWGSTAILIHPDDSVYLEYVPNMGAVSIGSINKANLGTRIKQSISHCNTLRQTVMQQGVST